MKTILPSPQALASELIQARRSQYLADLNLLLSKTSRYQWEVEMVQVRQEIARIQAEVMPQTPSVRAFADLAKLQSRFVQDVSLLSLASIPPTKNPAKQWNWFKALFGSTAFRKSGNPAPVFPFSLHSSTVC